MRFSVKENKNKAAIKKIKPDPPMSGIIISLYCDKRFYTKNPTKLHLLAAGDELLRAGMYVLRAQRPNMVGTGLL